DRHQDRAGTPRGLRVPPGRRTAAAGTAVAAHAGPCRTPGDRIPTGTHGPVVACGPSGACGVAGPGGRQGRPARASVLLDRQSSVCLFEEMTPVLNPARLSP